MPFEAAVLRVFIASPGDLPKDRDEVEAAIHEWNRQHAQTQGVVLLPQRWEGAAARQGGDGQQQINEQQVRDSDIVLAMFFTRLGRPTARAESGTAEEIELGEKYGKFTHVLVCRRSVDLGEVDLAEFGRLKNYIKTVQSRGLTKDFHDAAELRREVTNILWVAVNEYKSGLDTAVPAASAAIAKPAGTVAAQRSRLSYASSLGLLVAIVPNYPRDAAELDPLIRSLTAFTDTLARVTVPARRLLSELVQHGGTTGWGHIGLSVMELSRRLGSSQADVRDLANELDRYGLATSETEDGPQAVVLRKNPANLDWEFWDELRTLEPSVPNLIDQVISDLNFGLLDQVGLKDATPGPAQQPAGSSPSPVAPDVTWSLSRKGKNSFVLRNVGTDEANDVRVLPESASKLVRDLPDGVTVRPGASVEFLMFGALGSPVPNEITVASTGFDDAPQVVPVP